MVRPALAEVLGLHEGVHLRALVDAHPEIIEIDANPVVVLETGAVIVDARVRVDTRAPARSLVGRER